MRRPLLLAEGPPYVDGVRPKTDQAARNRFDEFIHGRRLKLLANYGEMDILWAERRRRNAEKNQDRSFLCVPAASSAVGCTNVA